MQGSAQIFAWIGNRSLETKGAANFVPAHDALVLAWLRKSSLRLELMFNFNARLLHDDLRRFVV